eukprot:2505152-Karenia_brevis.AAC.1
MHAVRGQRLTMQVCPPTGICPRPFSPRPHSEMLNGFAWGGICQFPCGWSGICQSPTRRTRPLGRP